MKKIIIVLTMILSTLMLYSEPLKLNNRSNLKLSKDNILLKNMKKSEKSITYNIHPTYGLAYVGKLSFRANYGMGIGIGKIQYSDKSAKEITYNLQYLRNSYYYIAGIYAQMDSYRNKERLGFVTILTTGLDYINGEEYPLCFYAGESSSGDCELKKISGLFPNIAIGYGYSFMLSINSRMLIYLDLGIKKNISNLNIIISF